MQVKILSNQEAALKAHELLTYSLFRPSFRVANIFDKKTNTVYITEFQDFLGQAREEFSMLAYRRLVIETESEDLIQFLPEDSQSDKNIKAYTTGNLYFLIAYERYFVVGRRSDFNRIKESRTDGLSLLGEVKCDGEFRPVWLPRFGFAIRGLSRSETRDEYFEPSFEGRALSRCDYSGLYILINKDGNRVFEEFGEDSDKLRQFLDVKDEKSKEGAWQLRNWNYPNIGDVDDDEVGFTRTSRFGLNGKRNYGGNYYGTCELSFEAGAGEIEVTDRNGTTSKVNCIPWTEYAFAETFYR